MISNFTTLFMFELILLHSYVVVMVNMRVRDQYLGEMTINTNISVFSLNQRLDHNLMLQIKV
jgi:hypothetical protein